jgi:hypothetical protein
MAIYLYYSKYLSRPQGLPADIVNSGLEDNTPRVLYKLGNSRMTSLQLRSTCTVLFTSTFNRAGLYQLHHTAVMFELDLECEKAREVRSPLFLFHSSSGTDKDLDKEDVREPLGESEWSLA